jgi:hypothetical protein
MTGRPALLDVVTEAWQTPIMAHRRAVAQATSGPPATPTGYGA